MSEPKLGPGQERVLDRLIDRVEDRLWGAPAGAHRFEEGAAWPQILATGLSPEAGYLWTRYNGMELAQGETCIASLAQIGAWTQEHKAQLRQGDLVVGIKGLELYVVPQDPWEEGAEVLLIDKSGQRGPLSSSVGHWVLATLGEYALLFDEEGEYREDLFDEHSGQMLLDTRRKILRRRLDLDPDAPLARFELGQLLRQQGEHRAAVSELKKAIKVAPEFVWSHFELGRAYFDQIRANDAAVAFEKAAKLAGDNDYLFAMCSAWAARSLAGQDAGKAKALGEAVLRRVPSYPSDQVAGARECLEEESLAYAHECVALGLAVAPRNLELLALARELEATPT